MFYEVPTNYRNVDFSFQINNPLHAVTKRSQIILFYSFIHLVNFETAYTNEHMTAKITSLLISFRPRSRNLWTIELGSRSLFFPRRHLIHRRLDTPTMRKACTHCFPKVPCTRNILQYSIKHLCTGSL